jgi:hypothetical protein
MPTLLLATFHIQQLSYLAKSRHPQCVLYRWHNSFGYAARKFYKSVSRILTCDTGMGTDVLGIFGMDFYVVLIKYI